MHRQSIACFSLCAAVLSAALVASDGFAPPSACPAPTVPQGGQCVMNGDAVITDTIWLASGMKLNCQGHQLTPLAPGILDDPRTAANEFQASIPELAMFVHRSYDVKIQNCVITGFDFGIIVARSKEFDALASRPTQNKIVANTIHVRTNAIDVIKSDGVMISDNHLTYDSERGRGVVIDYDSDGTEIRGNTIVSTDSASTGQVRQLPGGPFVTSTAIMDNEVHVLQSDKPLQNFVVSGQLFQIPSHDPSYDAEDSERTDHSIVESNEIVDFGVGPSCTLDPERSCRSDLDCTGKGGCLLKQNSAIGFNIRAADAVVRDNFLGGAMDRGVSFAGNASQTTIAGWLPGSCSLDPKRVCSSNADCNIAGYDLSSVGSCLGAAAGTFNGNSIRLIAEGNVLSGVYDTGALFANQTDRFVFRGNRVEGGANGIRILSFAVNGSIERNIVSGSATALYLGFAPSFTQRIQLNDFVNYSVAIRTSNDFATMTDISADTGNYWGLPCPGFERTRVLFDNGSVNSYVLDGKPYGVPVAATPDARLPARCQ
jgi:nitrous oxidase accessory protein NosD